MSFRDTIRKYQLMINAQNNKPRIIWIDSPAHLTADQIESKTEIYIYLEI